MHVESKGGYPQPRKFPGGFWYEVPSLFTHLIDFQKFEKNFLEKDKKIPGKSRGLIYESQSMEGKNPVLAD